VKKNEILSCLEDDRAEGELFKKADKIRKKYCGDEVHIRGIIEFSNYCSRNCLYCGLRRENRNVRRYRIKKEEVVDLALKIASLGIKTLVLQSGDDLCYPRDSICEIISGIKKMQILRLPYLLEKDPLRIIRHLRRPVQTDTC